MKRLSSVLSPILSVITPFLTLGATACGMAFLIWFLVGGGLEILTTIVIVIENGFKRDWQLAEVVLVLLIFYLIIRKR